MTQTVTAENIKNYLDKNGYLIDLELWNLDIAKLIAEFNNIKLSDDHIIFINSMRKFYQPINVILSI